MAKQYSDRFKLENFDVIRKALSELVALKRHREQYGKDALYMNVNPGRWRKAETALALVDKYQISDGFPNEDCERCGISGCDGYQCG